MKLFARLTPIHIVFTCLLGLISFFVQQSSLAKYIHGAVWGTLAFYFIQGLIINLAIDWAKRNSTDKLHLFLLGSVAFRLLTSIFACIFVLLIGIDAQQLFIINFFAVYLVYLVFEMTTLVANLRPNLSSQ
ncbi:hypothetical protein [Marinoscillum sp.]|uniref:hypothetical protein n=1 Tax=Marinoscillum sp. TaxID=2024838 RepID=UPI003BAA7F6F